MRILLVNYEWPNVTTNCGGGGRIAKTLATQLAKKHDVQVITDTTNGHHTTFPIRKHRHINRVIDQFAPDVVHGCFSLPSSLGLPRLCRKHNVPLVTTVMGADVYDPTRYHRIRPLMDHLNSYIFKHSNAVVAPSTDMAARVRRKHGMTPSVVHYGIETGGCEWRKKRVADCPNVLTVSRLVARKNLDVVARAATQMDGAAYRSVGKGPLMESLQQLESANTEFVGYADDLTPFWEWGDVFVLPSEHEAFGIVFLEALAHGLPVVTSNQGGQTDIIDESVGVCVSPTVSSVADGIRTVLEDYERYQSATESYVQSKFSSTVMAEEYEEVYQSVQ